MSRNEAMVELCFGLSLVYMDSDGGVPDELVSELHLAMRAGNEREMKTLSAVMLCVARGRKARVPPVADKMWRHLWG